VASKFFGPPFSVPSQRAKILPLGKMALGVYMAGTRALPVPR
jgi:hypothetical protein